MTTDSFPDPSPPLPFCSFFPDLCVSTGLMVRLRRSSQGCIALVDLEQLRGDNAAKAEQLLSQEELDWLRQLRHPKRRQEWTGGRIAAKSALLPWRAAETLRQLTILPDPHGRPAVSGLAEQDRPLSITHSGAYAAAFTAQGRSCGLDLQQSTPRILALASRFASSAELALLAQLPLASPEARLTMLWSVKEALKKSVLADRPLLFAGMEVTAISAAGDHAWRFDCAVRGCPPQTAAAYALGPYLLALTFTLSTQAERL